MSKPFSIAIDGPSAAGKSTIAKIISQRTGALYLDTGAMYRAVGLYVLRNGIDPRDAAAVASVMDKPKIAVRYENGAQRMFLFSEDVTDEIRKPIVSDAASAVSAVPKVRKRLVQMQREIAQGQNVVMDGRDIGTHVLPNATLKVFLVADPEIRALRRHRELVERGSESDYDSVLRDMLSRDHDDRTRAASPLTKAKDAVEINATHMSPAKVAGLVIELLNARIRERRERSERVDGGRALPYIEHFEHDVIEARRRGTKE